MITIFNRKELYSGFSMVECSRIGRILKSNNIPYTIKDCDLNPIRPGFCLYVKKAASDTLHIKAGKPKYDPLISRLSLHPYSSCSRYSFCISSSRSSAAFKI